MRGEASALEVAETVALLVVGAHGADVLRGWFWANCARRRSPLHAALLGGCYVMSMGGGVCVKNPVPGRSFQS